MQIKFKGTILKSSLCEYSAAYILVKRTITITRTRTNAAARPADETNKQVIFKNGHQLLISEVKQTIHK